MRLAPLALALATAWGANGLGAQETAPARTAVNVLENAQGWFASEEGEEPTAPLRRWFFRARLDELPDPPICEEADPSCPEIDDVYRDPLPWLVAGLPANLAVLRDMHGWLYLAGCPAVELPRKELLEAQLDDDREPPVIDPLSVPVLRGCLDIEKGRSFSMARTGSSIRLLVRGRQVPMQLIALRQAESRGPGTPYQPETSETTGAIDTTPRVSVAGGVFDTSPQWTPPPAGVKGTPSDAGLAGPELPEDGVPTGRVRIRCDVAGLGLSLDGAYMGECPLLTPLTAGRHFAQWRARGRQYEHMFRLEAGETVRLHINQANECVVESGVE